MEEHFKVESYDRNQTSSGVMHIGIGNFHRAHQEFFTHQLLQDKSQSNWAICGVCLLPQDERIYKSLKKQNCMYTLTVCGRDGVDEMHQIGSMKEVLWAMENPKAIVDKIANSDIKIITLTITEGGYNIDKTTGEFIFDKQDIAHDLSNPGEPTTVFGYVAEGLRNRMKNNAGPVTILTCDNLQHNGDTAKLAFSSFIGKQDAELYDWVKTNVTFPNSMVDRITPATLPQDVERLNKANNTNDEVPVYCEDFIQWVVEDNFAAGRPAWENVGVEFTDDVTAFENMKLSLLNASHTLLAYPSFLAGYRKVDEAMRDERFEKLLRNFMDIDITPYVPAPGNTDLDVYKQTLIERFGNKAVSDQISRLCGDGASKYPVYVIPNLMKMIEDNKPMERVAYSIASYRNYLKYRKDDNGASFEIFEPWLTEDDLKLIDSDNPLDFLETSVFAKAELGNVSSFVSLYSSMVADIKSLGALKVLENILDK